MKEIVTEKKSFKVRFISMFLAFMMLSMCIPVESFRNIKVMAANDDPIVLTNARVEFRDSRFRSVDSAVSGETFYLMITIAGNNVNFNNNSTYRIDIPDSNLLLTNFRGNGLVDGAEYNGFTMHVNDDGSRYITFDIKNGYTKMMRFQAKFANGKTADGESCEITISNSKGQSKSNSITAKSSVNWNSSKSQNMSSVDGDAIKNSGVSVNYTLSAAPVSKAQTGAWWLTGLQFNDTVTLPSGMSFTGKAVDNIKNSVASAIQNAGFSPDGDISVSINGGKADISFKINSSNTNAEMSRVSLNMPLNLNSETVSIDDSFQGGNIDNSLTVNGKPYGSDNYDYIVGENTVSLNVTVPTPPTPPSPADFNLSKYVNNGKPYYFNGDEVEFVISAINNGGIAGDIVLTDVIPDGLEFVSMTSDDGTVNDKSVTFNSVEPNQTVTATVKCKVTADSKTQLTNTVNGDNGKSASASINVRTKTTDINISKSGYVDGSGQNYYIGVANQKVHYTIIVSNNGTVDATDIQISDTIPSDILNPSIVGTVVDGVSISGNTLSGTVDIPAGGSVTINIEGTISADASGNIENTASADGQTSNTVTFTPQTPSPNLSINKSANISSFITGYETDVIYTITVKNDGKAAAKDVEIYDDIPADITVSEIKVGDTDVTSSLTEDNKFSTVISSIPAGETVTVTIKGTISNTAKSNIENKAECAYGNETKTSNTVTIYAGENPNKFAVTKKAINSDDSDKEYVVYDDDEIKYEVTFTNNSNDTLNELYMYDYFYGYYSYEQFDFKLNVVDGTEYGFASSYDVTAQPKTDDWRTNANYFTCHFTDIKIPKGETVTFTYSLPVKKIKTDDTEKKNTIKYSNEVYFDTTELNNTNGKYKATNTIYYYDVKATKIYGNITSNSGKSLSDYVTSSKSGINDSTTGSYPFTVIISGANNVNVGDNSKVHNTEVREIVIKDKIPEGMVWDESVTPTLNVWGNVISENSGTTLTTTVENGYLIFKIEFGTYPNLTWRCDFDTGAYAAVNYNLKAKDENSLKQNVKYENTVESFNIVYKDDTTFEKDSSTMREYDNPSADVTIKEISPAPGFAKKAYQSFAEKEYVNGSTDLNPAGEGYITAGDTLIWQAVVYNGGTDDGQTANLSNYSITDILPSNYSYDEVTGYPKTAWICEFDSKTGEYTTTTGTKVDVPIPVQSGNTVTWNFTGDAYILKPGQCLVLEFSTVAGKDAEGVITNSGYAEINQNFTDDDVIAGSKQDKKIYNYANYNIAGLITESWKTITYTSQGHTGVPHTDPQTDTGDSRNTTHNYVQGVQGEEVTYTINVKNNSPASIENFTVIDRLPYVNDKGLVSGYNRNSAFGVQFSEILSVKVGDTVLDNSQYQVSFSTDKTSVLNEYSGDWSGKNDVMTWSSDSTNAINFRICIDSSVKVKSGEEVVITFKGIVPSYVEKTGKTNIAWNSFAYSYQNTELLGDTVMVAEPAKVGVWVETPTTANKIVINKTVQGSTGGTFWFALFKDGTTAGTYERISDMVSVQLAENSTTGTVTMDNLDFESIKTVNNANNIYLFETTEKGDILTNENSVYSPSYTGNTIDTSKPENTVDVTNTKETGSISFTKTVVGNDDGVTDTFWFGLFTKQGNEFIRYEDAGIKSAVIKGSGSEKVTFSDIPKNITFYVFETNENGVIVDTLENGIQTLYTGSQNGEKYLVENTGSDGVKAGDEQEFTITNTKEVNYQITVNKILLSDDVKASQIFYVGLYDSETATKTDIVKSFTSETEAVFTYLDGTKTYYVAECDKDGNRCGNKFTQYVYLNNSETPENRTFTVTYDDNKNVVPFAAGDSEQQVSITNTDNNKTTYITINKNIISAAQPTEDMTINFGIYTIDSDGQYNLSKTVQAVVQANAFKQNTDGTYSASVSLKAENLGEGEYYVFEINDSNILNDGDTVEINGKSYVVSYENGNMVYLDGTVDGNITVSNKNSNESEIYFKKIDVTGKPLAGAELTITPDDSDADLSNVQINDEAVANSTIKWTTSDDKNGVKITGLPDGKYTLSEKAYNNYKGISVAFEVENGYIKYSGDNKAVYNVTADSMTIMNKAVVNVSKEDMGGTELAGALIKIVPDSDTIYLTNTEISRKDTTFTKVDKTDTDGDMLDSSGNKITSETTDYTNYYYSDASTIMFYSDGENKTEITGLPDGTYTMTEIIAPERYELAQSWTFEIKNGKVVKLTNSNNYEVDESSNTITMKDELSKTTVKVSKTDMGGKELEGALIKIVPTGDNANDISEVKISRDNTTFEKADKIDENGNMFDDSDNKIDSSKEGYTNYYYSDANTIMFYSDGENKTEITGLPDGTYTMTEVIAPNGYELAQSWTFEIKNGKVVKLTNSNNYEVDESSNTITMKDELSKTTVKVSKTDMGGKELEGALIKIVPTGDNANDISEVKISRDNTTFEKADKIDENGNMFDDSDNKIDSSKEGYTNYYYSDANTIMFYSDGENKTEITGLPDGTYTMTEVIAPNGYELAQSWTFEIKNGKVVKPTEENKNYTVDENGSTITMKDELSKTTVKVSKTDMNGTELEGALIKIVPTEDNDNNISGVTISRKDTTFEKTDKTDTDGDMVDSSGNKITSKTTDYTNYYYSDASTIMFYSDGKNKTEITGLPDGIYTMTEVTAPNGYDKAESWTFKIENGKVVKLTNSNNYAVDEDGSTITMKDKKTVVITVVTTTTPVTTTTTPQTTTTATTTTVPETTVTTVTTTTTVPVTTTTKATTTTTVPETTTTKVTTTTVPETTTTKATTTTTVPETTTTKVTTTTVPETTTTKATTTTTVPETTTTKATTTTTVPETTTTKVTTTTTVPETTTTKVTTTTVPETTTTKATTTTTVPETTTTKATTTTTVPETTTTKATTTTTVPETTTTKVTTTTVPETTTTKVTTTTTVPETTTTKVTTTTTVPETTTTKVTTTTTVPETTTTKVTTTTTVPETTTTKVTTTTTVPVTTTTNATTTTTVPETTTTKVTTTTVPETTTTKAATTTTVPETTTTKVTTTTTVPETTTTKATTTTTVPETTTTKAATTTTVPETTTTKVTTTTTVPETTTTKVTTTTTVPETTTTKVTTTTTVPETTTTKATTTTTVPETTTTKVTTTTTVPETTTTKVTTTTTVPETTTTKATTTTTVPETTTTKVTTTTTVPETTTTKATTTTTVPVTTTTIITTVTSDGEGNFTITTTTMGGNITVTDETTYDITTETTETTETTTVSDGEGDVTLTTTTMESDITVTYESTEDTTTSETETESETETTITESETTTVPSETEITTITESETTTAPSETEITTVTESETTTTESETEITTVPSDTETTTETTTTPDDGEGSVTITTTTMGSNITVTDETTFDTTVTTDETNTSVSESTSVTIVTTTDENTGTGESTTENSNVSESTSTSQSDNRNNNNNNNRNNNSSNNNRNNNSNNNNRNNNKTTTKTNTSSASSSPKTGDNSGILFTLLAASALTITISRKNKK